MRLQIPEAFRELFELSRYKAYFGGRGSAKSHSFARALLIQGAAQTLRIGCFREVQLSIRDSVKRLLDDCIDDAGLRGFYRSTDNEIRGSNGTLFLFSGLHGLTADKIKSLEGIDRAWVEEAQRVSQRSIDILLPTIRNDGSEIWFGWNPDRDSDPVDAMFRGKDGPPPGSIVREVNWHDNPWFPSVLRDQLEWDRRRDPDKYRHVWLGAYQRNSEARVFRNWRVEEFKTPADAEFRFGADWGFSVDPTVLIRCYLTGRTLYVDREAYAVGCDIDRTPALFDTIDGARKWRITADSARPETVSYMQRRGFKITAALKGPGSLEDGVEFLKSHDIVVHPRCEHTIDELANYSYRLDKLTDDVLPVLDDKKNHVIDALRYALEALRRRGPKWDEASRRNPHDPPDLDRWGPRKTDDKAWMIA